MFLVSKGLSDGSLTDLQQDVTSENCRLLGPTKVNNIIWNLLPHKSRAIDVATQRLQANTAKVMIAMANAMNDIKNAAVLVPSLSNAFAKVMDSFSLMASVNKELNL